MSRKISVLKPQDLITLLKLCTLDERWTFSGLSGALHISASEVHTTLERSAYARLYTQRTRQVDTEALLLFLIHGVRHAFPAQPGAVKYGTPTAWSVPPLLRACPPSGRPHIWPSPSGSTRGISIPPLYRSVLSIIDTDRHMYTLLALVDAIRIGGERERALAASALRERIRSP